MVNRSSGSLNFSRVKAEINECYLTDMPVDVFDTKCRTVLIRPLYTTKNISVFRVASIFSWTVLNDIVPVARSGKCGRALQRKIHDDRMR